MKFWKFWPKLTLFTSKESIEHLDFIFRREKYDLFLKKFKNLILKKKIQRGILWYLKGWKFIFQFSKISNFFLEKMASMGRGKCWKKQSHEIWAHLEHPPRNHKRSSTRGGSVNHPPCRIGLSFAFNMNKFHNCYHTFLLSALVKLISSNFLPLTLMVSGFSH